MYAVSGFSVALVRYATNFRDFPDILRIGNVDDYEVYVVVGEK